MAEMAAAYTLMVEATPCRVLLLCLAPLTKKNKNLHLLAYSALVEGARELWMVRTTAGSHDPNNGSGPSEARPQAADKLGSGARFDPPAVRGVPASQGGTTAPCLVICKIGNHTRPGHLGAISNALWFPLRILSIVGRISGSGGKAYSS